MASGQKKISIQLGREDWAAAARIAETCSAFVPDVEEEQVADEVVSCYNCRFRRWTMDAIACLAHFF